MKLPMNTLGDVALNTVLYFIALYYLVYAIDKAFFS